MGVKDVQCLSIRGRHELEVLSFSLGLFLNSTTYHFVLLACHNICVPNENVVDIRFPDPDRPCSTVRIKLVEDELHNLLSSLMFVILGYAEDLADAKSMHILLLTDGADELG